MTPVALGLPLPVASTRADAVGAPTTGPMVDRYRRTVGDLRVSVTDRCNLRCTYCMPADGLDWLPADHLLSTAEMIRVMTVAVRDLDIHSVRFTGGEPLLRRDLDDLVAAVAEAGPHRPEISMTTNGLGLAHRIDDLVAAGLDRLNVSLDTVDAGRFAEITRRDRLDDVLTGLEAARASGIRPIKVNAVVPTRADLDGLPDLLDFCLEHGFQLRVIEQMPLDAEHRWNRADMVTADEILDALQTRRRLLPDPRPRGSAPAATWVVDDHLVGDSPARVGVIASVTRPFCGDCDRTRLTADGALRNCLFAQTETDLRPILRGGLSGPELDAAIATAWRIDTWTKARGHGSDEPVLVQPDRPMSAIGG